jgi:hypothetical protein
VCPDGEQRYQARAYVSVANRTMNVWEARCLKPTLEVAHLIEAKMLVAEVDGAFPDPVVVPTRCCGQGLP